jgi:hypothetical protein
MVVIGQEQGKIGCHHYSALAENVHYKEDTKRRHVILMLVSIYRMGDAAAFMLKGEAPLVMRVSLYLHN